MRVIDVEHLGRPRVIGCWEVDGCLVDPGPQSSMETLLEALGDEQPRALLLTHIHLDHAAATGALVRRWPQLEVYVHERGAPHLVDPSRLLASAERLYGEEMERLWGEIVPVPEANVKPILPRRPSLIVIALFVFAATASLFLVACGDEEEAQSLTFTVAQEGKGSKVSGPQSAEPGLAEITLKNDGKGESDLQLIRVEGDHSAEEAIEGLEAAMDGKAFPEWFFAGGGVGITAAGKSQAVTQVLEPGTYYAFDTEGSQGPPDAASVPTLEVSGEESDETVEADTTVEAFEYGFEAEELPSGKTEIAFDNTGAQPHHLLASPLVGDSTAEDVERFFKTSKGKPPLEEEGGQTTAVIEGGEGQLITLDLEPGRYALYCFISDRQGGPPHALKGMVGEVEVE